MRGKRIDTAALAASKPAEGNEATRAATALKLPLLEPQLATLVDEVPRGKDWIFEVKLDGYRLLPYKSGKQVRLISRNGKDWTASFPELAKQLSLVKAKKCILDGELVVLDKNGKSNFQALQQSIKESDTDFVFFVFDVLFSEGKDVRGRSTVERRKLLKSLLPPKNPRVRFLDYMDGSGDEFFREGCRLGLEGIIAKEANASYTSGRTKSWLKIKCIQRQEMVIVGFTQQSKGRAEVGALLLGYFEGGRLYYAGKVGTGFSPDDRTTLWKDLQRLEAKTSPLAERPQGISFRGCRWVEPKLVCEVAFSEWTEGNRLRHPSFQGMRLDKPASAVRRELPTELPKTKNKKAAK